MKKIRSALDVCQNEGILSVFGRLHNDLVKPRLLSHRIAVRTDEITDASQSRVQIPGPRNKTIQYRGLFSDSLPEPIHRILGTVAVRDQFCWEFTTAELFGPDIYFSADGKYIVPSAAGWEEKDEYWRRELVMRLPYVRFQPTAKSTSVESAFVLSDQFRFETNFGMWYYETLPKLAIYSAYCDRTGKQPTLVVPELTGLQAQVLNMLGFTDRIELATERLCADEVILPSQTGWSRNSLFNTPPSNVQWVRNALLATISPGDQYADRVYISRTDADFRQVDNETAVMEVLEPLGFEKYALAEMTLHEQVRLFAGADLVVGPHGAGMAHMVHTRATRFVELFPGRAGVMPYYFALANDLNHPYEFLICGAGTNRHPESDHPRHADIIVDTDKLKWVMSKQIEEMPSCSNE